MKSRFVRTVLFSLLCAMTWNFEVHAQGTASLRGTITDPTKAAIPSAKVTLTDKETGQVRSVLTAINGEYQFAQTRPGNYSLLVEVPGFSSTRVEDVKLVVDTPTTLDLSLDISSNQATVNVEADIQQLNTVDASVGNAFIEKQVNNLPLQTRNVVELLSLQPGVTQTGEVMGARRDQNNIQLDGVDVNDNQNALSGLNGTETDRGFNAALPVPLDSVQEFRVTVAGQGADDGRSSGGQVSMVTRGGTNQLHGSAYEFNRNTAYTSNTWFNNRSGLNRPQLVRNQFGASLGGPIKKDRAFFFLNYERRIDASQETQSRTVPSETLKQGLIRFQTTDRAIHTLNSSDIRSIDPLGIGVTQAMLDHANKYPVGNNCAAGSDAGLNFCGFLFNAPSKVDYRYYVGRFDYMVDPAGKHALSFRGTLSNQGHTNTMAQFPGQDPASEYLANNKGFALSYTASITPSLTNTARVGLTRVGFERTGSTSPSLNFGLATSLENFTRAQGRINPTWNYSDDLNWIKGKHTIQTGLNIRFIDNRILTYGNSFPSYSFGRGTLLGLGQDIYTSALNYVAGGNSSLGLSNATAVTNAFGQLLGLLNGTSITYNYLKDGSILPIGDPRQNNFINYNYEFYVQDTWRATQKLTLTYGLRYSINTVPWEVNGMQVNTTTPTDVYFASRVGGADQGIPVYQQPNSGRMTYDLNGPMNGRESWYRPDKNNWAPRLSLAYAVNEKTVVRAGASMVYDQYGNDLVSQMATSGSPGITTTMSAPVSYNFTTSPRYGNGVLPSLPQASPGGYPFTPLDNRAISGGLVYGMNPQLVAPYSFLLNAAVSHQFAKKYTVEVGYVGRLSRKSLLQQDIYSPALYFKDPKSGVRLIDAANGLRGLYNQGLTAPQVRANPGLAGTNEFFENMFPGLANLYFPGNATANFFHGVYGVNAGSDLDFVHSLDRTLSLGGKNFPNCVSATGCFTFFAPQGSSFNNWTNSGFGNYHAMTMTVRRPLSAGLSFDLNYTLSHSIDNESSAASGAGRGGGVILNVWQPGINKASSDFDIRHQLNANFLYELPFGKGKRYMGSVNGWMNQLVGGWQLSGLMRVRSGLPVGVGGSGIFNTNYYSGTPAYLIGTAPQTGRFINENGNPSLFSDRAAAFSSFQDGYMGQGGTRNLLRRPWNRNVDLSVMKSFGMPWEGHQMSFRAEAFNAFNFVNFTTLAVGISNSTTFGQFSAAEDPRVFQLSLRYSF